MVLITRLIYAASVSCAAALGQEVAPPPAAPVEAQGLDSQVVELPGVSITGTNTSRTEELARGLDEARDGNLFPKVGATSSSLDREAIDALPRGADTPLDKVLLQLPGVSYDSAVSNVDFHVRNEYANVQYRIDGILLPEGVSGIGSVLDTGFIGKLDLLDGVLPAQYGLRTAAVVDLTTRVQAAPAGNLGIETGSRGTVTPRFEYGAAVGDTQYYITGRYFRSDEGVENPEPTTTPMHDRTQQDKFFAYGSTLLGATTRLTYITGAAHGRYQIPTVDGQAPLGDFGAPALRSSTLDDRQSDRYWFGLVALQDHRADNDVQVSVFTRYAGVHFVPDVDGELAFNDVASDVERRSLLNGLQLDDAYRITASHTLRAGFGVTAERTHVADRLTVLPLSADGTVQPTPETIVDADVKLGWNAGAYLQDEWRLSESVTLNSGVRFDYLEQYVTAHQLSPRAALVYRPADDVSVHAGYARYFTPPMQVYATPSRIALFDGTTEQPAIPINSPARPERSNYVDIGVDATIRPGLTVGVDVYRKRARDFLDDGQFGEALVFSQFNFARGRSEGVELKLACRTDGFQSYLNLSANKTQAKDVVSNGYLFTDPAEYAYVSKNYIYSDDTQLYTASAGASYRFGKTLWSVGGIFGSGLRSGFANTSHAPGYVQLDLAAARDFAVVSDAKPLNVRVSVVNLLDRSYLLRSGDGIGEFAPQYGPRRGVFLSLSQGL
jgi:outer membrane receptor protein involved in Fe transport